MNGGWGCNSLHRGACVPLKSAGLQQTFANQPAEFGLQNSVS